MSQGTAERVLELYERGLAGCARQSAREVSDALIALIDMLDFDEPSGVADGFHRLYSFCLRAAFEERFDRAAWILANLRETWTEGAPAHAVA